MDLTTHFIEVYRQWHGANGLGPIEHEDAMAHTVQSLGSLYLTLLMHDTPQLIWSSNVLDGANGHVLTFAIELLEDIFLRLLSNDPRAAERQTYLDILLEHLKLKQLDALQSEGHHAPI